LFRRHPDIIKTLSNDAPTLLPKLLDGLIWRSRTTENGMRRANYYLRHLLMDADNKFSPSLSWISKSKDPRLVCHPVLVLLSDTVWSKQAMRAFLYRKSWFLITLLVFIAGQSILKHLHDGDNNEGERIAVFAFRAFIYFLSMPQLLYVHASKSFKACSHKDSVKLFGCFPLPGYLVRSWQEVAGFLLMIMLVSMIILEPILWCFASHGDKLFLGQCKDAEGIQFIYSLASMFAMCLYYALLLDLAVLSTKVSAYVLVCIRMLSEVFLFLLALFATLLTFGSSISVVEHHQSDFNGIHKGMLVLLEMAMRMYDGKHFEMYESDPLVLVMVFVFLITAVIFLLNMLVAQLTCAYEAVYGDMVGYARLERIEIICNTMTSVSESRWYSFCESLRLHEKCEFGAGDIGVTGGLQVYEAANLNPTTRDMIRRFGGSTSVDMQWPIEQEIGDEGDRFERLESLVQKSLKRMTKGRAGKGGSSGSGTGSHSDEQGDGTGSGEKSSSGGDDDA